MANDSIDADDPAEDCRPAAEGILHCLEMLAEEAAILRLRGTLQALHHAIAACAVEAVKVADSQAGRADLARPGTATLH